MKHNRRNGLISLTIALFMLLMLIPASTLAAVETRDLPVTVRWDFGTSTVVYTALPTSIVLTLKQMDASGTVLIANYRSVTLSKSSFPTALVWTGAFTNVPKATVGGYAYTYSVTWPDATGFTLSTASVSYDSGANATYSYGTSVPSTCNVSVAWDGEPVNYTGRPSAVSVQLNNATSSNSMTASVTPATGWSYQFTGITGKTTATEPITVSATVPSGYTASYSTNSSGTLVITMTYNVVLTNISGDITWPSVLPTGITIPSSVTIALVQGGVSGVNSTVATMTVPTSGAGANSFLFSGYPLYDANGQAYYYGVVEFGVTNFTAAYSGTNTYRKVENHVETYENMNLRVNVRWVDNANKREKRPIETTVYLYRDGVYTGDAIQVSYGDQWTNVFPDQPRTNGYGHYYQYSVRGAKVLYYYFRTAYANYNASTTLTYIFGSGSSTTGEETTVSSKAPAVGDRLAYDAQSVTASEFVQMMREDARAKSVYAKLSTTLGDSAASGKDVDFTSLKKTNADIAAWIKSDGTDIDYPIVKGTNNTYYLNHLFNKESNRSGTLFMDVKCSKTLAGRNTVIYGHHMADGAMFANLLEYKKQAYYTAHPTMKLYTPSGNYTVELFAGFTTGDERDAVARLAFSGDSDFMTYINACIKKSDFDTGVDVSANDKIITLVTCSYDYDSTRYLVMGRLVEG